ncbi:MAG TPA: SpoIID/LytB domain-containing protein [Tissierellaceae bacterium]|nr:SpoIID/LytB domain-containing protein [Tissierellaceae bacterium]
MKNKYFKFSYLLLILIFIVSSGAYAVAEDVKYIDIKLSRPLTGKNLINLESENGFSIYDMDDKLNQNFFIEDNDLKVVLNEIGEISFLDNEDNVLFELPKENNFLLKSNGEEESTIKVEKNRYRGYLRFKVNNGNIIIINHIEMENYLYGVVPSEMGYNFPKEALKAQAVAARSYARRNIDKHLNEGFSLCDTTHCQAYYGYDKENPLTNFAVDETKGLLAYYDGEIINAQYHSTSSGVTENSIDAWGGDLPYLISVKDDFSLDAPLSSWTLKLDIFELNNKLVSNGIDIGLLKGIEVIESSSSGSVKMVKLIGNKGDEIISGSKFRTIIGNTTLKSTWFNVAGAYGGNIDSEVYIMGKDGIIISKKLSELSILDNKTKKPISRSATSRAINRNSKIEDLLGQNSTTSMSTSEIIIEGRGYGHGVGMSQYGAKKMAELGYTFEEILKHYYTGIDIL